LLDNAAGACFILQGMASAPVPSPRQEEPATVEQQRLAQMSMYQGIG